jgi:nucleoside-diphosphate-sugar epimerase
VAGDLRDSATWANLGSGWDAVLWCASSGGAQPEAWTEVVLRALDEMAARGARLGLASSTAVYARQDGAWVDETWPADGGDDAKARGLARCEARALALGGTVFRLGGIYGPERGWLLRWKILFKIVH